ncbi:MAG: CDGSH iron-sulfur domain-containing protein [Verrucomicrobiota bacterium]
MNEPKIADKSPKVMEVEPGDYWWFACGLSSNQPLCDGSHKGTDFGPKKVTIEEGKTVAFCQCKHTKNSPFCDGAHAGL